MGAVKSLEPIESRDDDAACALARAAARAADELHARCIVAFTLSGEMARLLSRERSLTPILACARDLGTLRRLALVWGVRAIALERTRSVDDLFAFGERIARLSRGLGSTSMAVLLAGKHEIRGGTYMLRIARLKRS